MNEKLFYELKSKCLEVWEKYQDRPGGYYEEKVAFVNRITNPADYYILVNIFDLANQRHLFSLCSPELKEALKDYIQKAQGGR